MGSENRAGVVVRHHSRLYGCRAICVLSDYRGCIQRDTALVFQLKERLCSFVGFLFRVKNNYQHSIGYGLLPSFRIAQLYECKASANRKALENASRELTGER